MPSKLEATSTSLSPPYSPLLSKYLIVCSAWSHAPLQPNFSYPAMAASSYEGLRLLITSPQRSHTQRGTRPVGEEFRPEDVRLQYGVVVAWVGMIEEFDVVVDGKGDYCKIREWIVLSGRSVSRDWDRAGLVVWYCKRDREDRQMWAYE
jgi:hypothetical protein